MLKVSCKDFVTATRGAGADISVDEMVSYSGGLLVRAGNMIMDTRAKTGVIIADIDNIKTGY